MIDQPSHGRTRRIMKAGALLCDPFAADERISLKTLMHQLRQTCLSRLFAAVTVVLNNKNHSLLQSR